MAEYELANGYVLTDDEIEKRAQEWEDGSWEGDLVTLKVGRPRLSAERTLNISFKCPETAAHLIEEAAKASGVKKSEFLRSAAVEKAERVLAHQN